MRPHLAGDRRHLGSRRHLQVERLADRGPNAMHIIVADVPPVLAQMDRDAVGTRGDCCLRRIQRIGMRAAARVADGGDVVDVHA